MENMNAMHYEYLIRRAYKCGRYGTNGADADLFRALERVYYTYRIEKENKAKGLPRQWGESIEQLAYKYGHKCGDIACFMNDAISKVINDYDEKLSPEQKDILTKCTRDLIDADINTIIKVINISQETMIEIGLYPG